MSPAVTTIDSLRSLPVVLGRRVI